MKTINFLLLAGFFFALSSGCKKDLIIKNDKVTPHDFLSGNNYEKLIVEVQYVSGYMPASETMNALAAFLQKRLNKPGGIIISEKSISSRGKSYYTMNDIKDIEKSERTENTGGNTITAYLLFIDGEYAGNAGNSKTLGITYSNSSMVIFEKTIRDYSGGITEPKRDVLESTVINHEFGHIFGLVNNGSDMQGYHQDVNNGKHCNNKNCLMHYLAETSDIISNLLSNAIPEFDSNCINDLQANGGK